VATSLFHPIIQTWFERRFGVPTEAQAQGWPAIAAGRHTLIAAPTGSGKTLAAFLTSLDSLVRQALDGGLTDATQVVYVSPLKALANDIRRNLIDPLGEITAIAEEVGTPLPEIRVGVRTGDTPAKERALHAKRPPHVLVTTPESLFILLTSERGRNALKSTRTLILDELHAVAPNKRGSHLLLSVERLCHLAEQPVTRIGLSATQKPIELMASFLTGASSDSPSDSASRALVGRFAKAIHEFQEDAQLDGAPFIVNVGHKRNMDISVEIPENFELGPVATHEQWAQTLDEIAKLIEQHHTTLLFVNTRRLVERVAHLLSERLGEENVAAHHGSLSKETRFDAEQRLKAGAIKVCVATASLELGIDVGDVDLVCQVGSTRNIGVALQRVGRSGHWLGGTPKGRFYPLTRDELVETVALLRAINGGRLDALQIPPWPLDVLAQQVVAACVTDEWEEDELFNLVRQAYPYHDLSRERFDDVIEMLSEGIANRWGRGSAYLHRDGVHHKVKARRGARLAAITNGGAIPDTADYIVVAEPEGTTVGTVNEDFAIESMAGDVFLLGNVPWKIRRVESGSVRVESAVGMAPTIPFWLGETPGRTVELSEDVSVLRREVDERLPVPETAIAWVMEAGVSRGVAEQVVEYIAEGKRVLGMVPTAERIIAERFFDEAGGMQLVIHSPWGARINRAWGLALRKRFCVGFNFELQAAATDEGINISLGPQHSFPVEEVFKYVKTPMVKETVLQALLQGPIFPVRWRWVASRSLALLRQVGGKRVPTTIQRMRSDDLLAAVFPDAAACQDNMPAGMNITPPDHPLVFETVRDCLYEALDLEGLTALLTRIESGEIEVYGKDTVQPSAFSHQILNAMPYAFLDDAPLEERRARAVTLRRALPEDSLDLGALDADAIVNEEANAWPSVRDADELHDALLSMMVLGEADILRHAGEPAIWNAWFRSLVEDDRAYTLSVADKRFWVAAERVPTALEVYPEAMVTPSYTTINLTSQPEPEETVVELLRGHAESSGPFTVAEMAEGLALELSLVNQGLIRLETQGMVLRGKFRPGAVDEEFCDRRILARIHRATIGRLRREIEPVPVASLIRFLLEWQHATLGSRVTGEAGMIEVVEQLQGFEAAAAVWESALLPYRLTDFHSSTLDALCFGGELAWGRFTRRPGVDQPSAGLSRNGPVSIALREDVEWLLDPPNDDLELRGAPADVLEHLQQRGASFMPDIVAGSKRLPSEVEDALWVLVAAGLVTADGFGALRGLVSGLTKKVQRRSRFTRRAHVGASSGRAGSRWAVLARSGPPVGQELSLSDRDDQLGTPSPDWSGRALVGQFAKANHEIKQGVQLDVDARAAQLLRRYGVITRELLAREPMAPPWRLLVGAYRSAEARGEIRGGRFVAGLVGEQFALPEAVDGLRAVNRREPTGEVVRLSACDPLNLVGIITPGSRVPAVLGNEVLYRDGVPVESAEPVAALLA
jgi:ATP-dependent Lhr-like helicase